MERDHRLGGRELIDVTTAARVPEVGRQPAARDEPAREVSAASVPIAPDLRDHSIVPRLRAAADVELRTLVAHVERNLDASERASTEPEREAARAEIQTRCDVAMHNVAPADHAAFLEELQRLVGAARWDAMHELLAATPDAIIQRDAAGAPSASNIQRTAQHGVASGGGQLPHLAQIQRSFGRHDLSTVSAHVGGSAAQAALAIGARAYAVGNKVAFSTSPDLRLAAHEAAHVVQQRRGVSVSGGVGRAGDAYEQHADAVADLVVRGESAEELLERQGSEGATSEAVQLDPLEVLGHYTGRDVTMQLAQAGTTVVGRIQVHRRGSVGVSQADYELSVERTASEDSGDRFSGHAGTRSLRITVAPDGAARVVLAGQSYVLHRDSSAPALSGQTLRAAGAVDLAAESAPLTDAQQRLVDYVISVAGVHLREFFSHGLAMPATHEQRLEQLALVNGAVGRLFRTQTRQESRSLAMIVRARLREAPLVINGRSWGVLDWISVAMAQMTDDPLLAHLRDDLEIPVGVGASVLDGGGTPRMHCYRLRITGAVRTHPVAPFTYAGAGRCQLEVSEFSVPAGFDASHADPHADPAGVLIWTAPYTLTRERIELGLSASGSYGPTARTAQTTVYTPWPWDRGDFVGPISGIRVAASASSTTGEHTRDPLEAAHADALMLYGTCAFPALPLDLDPHTTAVIAASVSATAAYEQGQIDGEQSSDPHPHLPTDERAPTPVAEVREVRLAFATDEADLSAAARRQLREVLAWHSAVLATATVDVTGFASRLGSIEHNQELAGRRTTNTMHAIVDALPALAERITGSSRGEGAAEAAGVADGDNDQEWRKVEVNIAGQVVLRLYAEVPMTIADAGTIPAQ